MRDLIWIAALAAVLAGVWFFMARLDELLKGSAPQEPEALAAISIMIFHRRLLRMNSSQQ